jgi:hypothetical protein
MDVDKKSHWHINIDFTFDLNVIVVVAGLFGSLWLGLGWI